ncbi:YbaB/EbfC family nucleoid-associated protein [Nonomuraea zeae]|uniref:YbaB/EbfC family nucleoid-associated protein n=1 Tax=Nonomuraea zeae TaxID=1642303 RepID=A0A5S4GST2_9ACTN|nr:YbaB/EbfC family nucleoid-associated protein [Nonomuraea zeae]TMR35976.1 YbaB/EbfC family nucleoid-associated protein [Nonomuraea zeae]
MDADDTRLTELDKFVQASERSMRELGQAMQGLRRLSGAGESATGAVSARVDADSRLVDLAISPRAMKLGSHDLSREVIEAVAAAQLDHERQAKALIAFLPDGDGLLDAFQRDLTEVQDTYTAETHERLDRMRHARSRLRD